jgi:hypothetical protein
MFRCIRYSTTGSAGNSRDFAAARAPRAKSIVLGVARSSIELGSERVTLFASFLGIEQKKWKQKTRGT